MAREHALDGTQRIQIVAQRFCEIVMAGSCCLFIFINHLSSVLLFYLCALAMTSRHHLWQPIMQAQRSEFDIRKIRIIFNLFFV